MVHFYHDVSNEEIRTICTDHLGDIELVLTTMKRWIGDQLLEGSSRDV